MCIEVQQIQFMFHWCQNVNVYNVENHYHFYSDHDNKNPRVPDRAFEKLKVGSISVASGGNRRHNSRSCPKKGLNLAKTLENGKSPSPTANTTFTKSGEKNEYFNSSVMYDQHVRSATICQSDIVKIGSYESRVHGNNLVLPGSFQSPLYKTQRILRKHKPATSIYDNPYAKAENNNLISQLYSSKSRVDPSRSAYSNPTHQNQHPELQSKQASTHQNIHLQAHRNIQEARNASYKILGMPPQKKDEALQLATTQAIYSKQRTESDYDLSGSERGYNNSKYNVSKSGSEQEEDNSNERVYYRIMEMSRGEARQASIMLSNILSRSGKNSYQHCSTQQLHNPLLSHDRKLNFEDRQTILSQNDALSEASLKIEESELYELDPHNNFTLIKNKTITSSTYTLDLAIENTLNCVVTLKEVGFREMSVISQELQMYEFLQQKLLNSDTYRNVLELYQVQMSNGSYLLIKQPYTHSLQQYMQLLSSTNRSNFSIQLLQMVTGLLDQFAMHLIYPSRLLKFQDFVVCESVVKFHDLSVFKQMKRPIFQTEVLLKELQFEKCQSSQGQTS